VELRHGAHGEVEAGRKTRVIPAPLRRALRARDGGCVFPGCTNRRCDGHHVQHWAAGGATTLENVCLMCDLCRARHKSHYAAYPIMPRSTWPSTERPALDAA
jgi:hypothetical protein